MPRQTTRRKAVNGRHQAVNRHRQAADGCHRAAPRPSTLTLLAGCVAGLAALPAWAQPAPPAGPADTTPLAEITTTATRTERRVDAVPGTVTVTTGDDAQARGARDLKDLFRHEVDLSVRAPSPRFGAALGSTGRAGNEGINIRGLEGNQVLLAVDGIRVPLAFSFGAFATGRAEYLSLDTVQTVEVLRGPAGTQFGSDGLAGAVVLQTLEPADLLRAKPAAAAGNANAAFWAGLAQAGLDTVDDTRSARTAVGLRAGPV
jgi:hemoglobin/transferrin/lactoferrin receptor protein